MTGFVKDVTMYIFVNGNGTAVISTSSTDPTQSVVSTQDCTTNSIVWNIQGLGSFTMTPN